MLAVKSVRQSYNPDSAAGLQRLFEIFRCMTNDLIRIGLANEVSTLKKLSRLSYNELACYDILSYYKACAISRVAGILSARKKSIKRGHPTKTPYAVRPILVSCYGFKIDEEKGELLIPVAPTRWLGLHLTKHTLDVISQSGVRVRSFALTPLV